MKKFTIITFLLFITVSLSQAQKMSLSIQPTIALPMGDFGDSFDMGFGGTGTIAFNINDNLAITGTAGYLTWSASDVDDVKFNSIPVLGGIRYYFNKSNFSPYLAGQVGMHFLSADYPSIDYSDPFHPKTTTKTETSSELGFGAGAGFLYALSKSLNLDITVLYNVISTEGSSTSFLGIAAGVGFGL